MMKAANVQFMGWDKVGSGLVRRSSPAMSPPSRQPRRRSAAAGRIGEVISVQVIPRPHDDLGIVLPEAKKVGQANSRNS